MTEDSVYEVVSKAETRLSNMITKALMGDFMGAMPYWEKQWCFREPAEDMVAQIYQDVSKGN